VMLRCRRNQLASCTCRLEEISEGMGGSGCFGESPLTGKPVGIFLFVEQANAEQAHEPSDFGFLNVDHFP
jgi:hypothetical protein